MARVCALQYSIMRLALYSRLRSAAPNRDMPDHVTIFVLFTLLDTGVASIRIDSIFFPLEQFGDLGHIDHVGGGAMDVMNQSRLNVSSDGCLHTREILVTFLGLIHLGIALAVCVLGRTRSMNNGSVDNGAPAQRQAFFLQISDGREDCRRQLMLLLKVPEVHDLGVFRDRRTQRQACKLAHGSDFVERLFHGRIAQGEPVLQ